MPLWRGPYEDGITQSMINKFLFCRERFRLLLIKGLREPRVFNHYTEYGSLWHEGEEALAGGNDWKKAMLDYATKKQQEFPDSAAEITKWYQIAKRQFPVYVEHWRSHPDVKHREPIAQEHEFALPYELPSGRVVVLRGKIDACDWIGKGKARGVYVQENKTKGNIDEENIGGQLVLNFQTMFYEIATQLMGEEEGLFKASDVKGARYNVVRRPLAYGCKYFFRQKKGREVLAKKYPRGFKGEKKYIRKGAESDAQFYERIGDTFKEDPTYWFHRWKVEIHKHDIENFKMKVLNPLLEELCDWWEWMEADNFQDPWRPDEDGVHGGKVHFMLPLGIYNPLAEGRQASYHDYLLTGSDRYLEKVTDLFPELDLDPKEIFKKGVNR